MVNNIHDPPLLNNQDLFLLAVNINPSINK